MDAAQVLSDAIVRIRDDVHDVAAGLGADELAHQVAPDTNPIGWLLWHPTRVQDAHVDARSGPRAGRGVSARPSGSVPRS